ncbi:tRNA (adenosine(37)-N6)-threonylcarbamoyltransferase complex ATPase subunit type 1 TsaE [Leucobacter tenebrionis]|uniref:tRNA (adenosine(37)-N6)-threonylcarbamoyltransferase complex ATPase subunit type 1 TsaE n=1 Tax=Leucobacter tenebrionis TaxID=2873270 RepID=UPI001CA65023|nr:tRNA (adenosine(37)-N6)-threonylcarbamoyltransferase complex ATPase subunit type 1 TsaE [Leucobacter tenebrionis]QZY52756.1 tRNA (adenosine(37)-N6)-threonylcarbamoyltransferase complex ATPase subunit type 1 TsaE [Leucobacter tenebrionis]
MTLGDDAGNTVRLSIADPDAMHELGVRLGRLLRAGDLVLLTGPLGAGKTTLTRGIGEGLGVRGPVQSPTFVLARTHPSLVGGAPLVHVDAYRIGGAERGGADGTGADGRAADRGDSDGAGAVELDDLDLDFEGSVVVAEWGAGMVEPRGSWMEVVIERPVGSGIDAGAAEPDWSEAPVEARIVTVTGYGPRWGAGETDPLGPISEQSIGPRAHDSRTDGDERGSR